MRGWWISLMVSGCFVTDAELAEALDRDGDGYLPVQTGGDDCDEGRADVNPGAAEVCGDGLDNDCDGIPDDDGVGARLWFLDDDGDGFGTEVTTSACVEPPGFAPVAGDCDDADPAINPGVDDLCDGIDQDCDGVPDDEVPLVERFRDADGDGIGTDAEVVLACTDVPGFVNISGDCDDSDPTVSPVAVDLCDGLDQDCDGVVDDDAVFSQFYRDADGDGIGTESDAVTACLAPAGYVVLSGDCDDTDATISPAAVDLCDGVDQDCDGVADDDALLTLYFQDNDGDGAGNPDVAVETCGSVPGFVFASGDCDDTDPGISPFILDGCDGIDQDCDGSIDEDAVRTLYFEDLDGDGVGSAVTVEDCTPPPGFVQISGDCDDADGSVHPGSVDPCDGIDQDCDGAFDEDASFSTWFRDVDGDGLGRSNNPRTTCDGAPNGYVATAGDCDDTDGAVTIPEWFVDGDGDGVGVGGALNACAPPAGYVAVDGDCEDSDPLRYPGNPEICGTGFDEDCDDATNCRWPAVKLLGSADVVVFLPAGVSSVTSVPNVVGSAGRDLMVGFSGGPVELYEGPSSSVTTPSAWIEDSCSVVGIADVNGDGYGDVACSASTTNGGSIYLGGDAGLLSPAMVVQDGEAELLIADGALGAGLWVGDGRPFDFVPYAEGTFTRADAVSSLDLPTQSRLFLTGACQGSTWPCLVARDATTVRVFPSLGLGLHTVADTIWSTTSQVPIGGIVVPIVGYDMNADQQEDLVLIHVDTTPPTASSFVLTGPISSGSSVGSAQFVTLPDDTSAAYPIGDIDGDGWTDWASARDPGAESALEVRYGSPVGPGQFPDTVIPSNVVSAADWNDDGRTDLMFFDRVNDILYVIYGTGI